MENLKDQRVGVEKIQASNSNAFPTPGKNRFRSVVDDDVTGNNPEPEMVR
jgi:hypothetical protein